MISVLILTYNEELNINKCLSSIPKYIDDIVIIDSFSDDKTRQNALKDNRVRFYKNAFEGYAEQLRYAINQIDYKYDYIFRIDADEELIDVVSLAEKINSVILSGPDAVYTVNRSISFLGTQLKYGGCGEVKVPRIISTKTAHVTNVPIDEHFYTLNHEVRDSQIAVLDRCNKGLDFWLSKHISYASLEAINMRNIAAGEETSLKRKLYYRLPGPTRPLIYFFYRYFLQFGFLDGSAGFNYLFLQAFWFRQIVEIKHHQRKRDNND